MALILAAGISLKRYPDICVGICDETGWDYADNRVGQEVERNSAIEDSGIGAKQPSPEIFGKKSGCRTVGKIFGLGKTAAHDGRDGEHLEVVRGNVSPF